MSLSVSESANFLVVGHDPTKQAGKVDFGLLEFGGCGVDRGRRRTLVILHGDRK